MKLLYLSCHAILEYDECRIFEQLGIDWFSLGSYIIPMKPVDPIRPPIAKAVNEKLLAVAPDRDHLPAEFLDNFDVIVIMHKPEWIVNNWEVLKGRRVIWRTIGQSTPHVEQMLAPMRAQGLEVVRYCRRENDIQDNIGCDSIIHFYKDPNEFGNWNGLNIEVITFAQNMRGRGENCNYAAFEELATPFNSHVYGPKNEDSPFNGGFMSYEGLRQKMRDSRVYLYTGTQPASYTLNFIEAFMTGIPIVAIGPKLGNSMKIAGENTYAIPDFITNGVNGFVSDDMGYLRMCIEKLLNEPRTAKAIGENGRQTALAFFGMDVIQSRWKELLRI